MRLLYCVLIIFGILSLHGCATTEVLYTENWKDQYFDQLVRKFQVGISKKGDEKKLQLTEQELYDRDLRFLERLEKEISPDKWSKVFFIGNKIKKRKNELLRLQSRDLLSKDYELIQYVDLDSQINESRPQAANYYYKKSISALNDHKDEDRYAYRSIYATLDTVNIFQSDYENTDSLLNILKEKGKSRVLLDVPNDLEIPIQKFAMQLNNPWLEFSLDDSLQAHINLEVRLRKPSLQQFKDTIITCILAPKNQHDSLTQALYFDEENTLEYLRLKKNPAIAMVYTNMLVKQVRYCYAVDWKKNDAKNPYLFEVCEDLENIYKTFTSSGNTAIVNSKSCPGINEKTKNLTDEGVIGKAKQLAIRKLMEHVSEVSTAIDQ